MTSDVQFVPWMRRGIVRTLVTAADADGAPTTAMPAIEAGVTIGSTEVTRSLQIRGPGSVIGLASQQIVGRDPQPNTTDFEPSYFPAITLLSPDLPWMFTPAAPHAKAGDDRLMPWLVLVVVEDRAGISLAPLAGAPLEVLSIDDARRELPSLREAWAWAHVQASIAEGTGIPAAFAATPEAFVARLLCPRRLAPSTRYLACLVPSFDQGVSAGLGRDVDPAGVPAFAWTDATVALELPVYCSWRFGTSAVPGDFEAMVNRLTPRALSDVGVRDLDIGDPGSTRLPSSPGKVVQFRGALVAPQLTPASWDAEHKRAFQQGLHDLLEESLVAATDPRPYDARRDDPVVAPPVYGALAAGVDAVPGPDQPSTWLAEANLDPVHRAAAGLGAEVVRRNQEQLAAEVWDQVAALRQVNRTLNHARLALEVGTRIKARIDGLDDGALLQITQPVHSRIKRADMATTLAGRIGETPLPAGLMSGAFRRRTRSTTVARATRSTATTMLSAKLTGAFIADPTTTMAYARFTVPHGTVFVDSTDASGAAKPIVKQLRGVDLQMVTGMGTGGGSLVSATAHIAVTRTGLSVEGRSAPAIAAPAKSVLLLTPTPVAVDTGAAGSIALGDLAGLVREKLDPSALLRLRVRSLITAPAAAWTTDPVPAAMTLSPQVTQPAYELLAAIDPDLLCPGASELPVNTVGLMTTNPAFVEAFLLGANHELSSELVWREVPIDPGDTWMRTFWDPVAPGTTDIAPVGSWQPGALGTHRPSGGADPAKAIVLVIKGELLRRYPGTLVYAVRARWQRADGTGAWERVEGNVVAQPVFVGSLGGDAMFLGFQFDATDVDLEVAGSTEPQGPHPGWFFVFEQPATEPRFGLDVGQPTDAGAKPAHWKDVSWFHVLGDATSSTATHVPLAALAGVACPYDDTGENTWTETWARDAAAMARITLQRPVRMLVHADQMLRVAAEGDH